MTARGQGRQFDKLRDELIVREQTSTAPRVSFSVNSDFRGADFTGLSLEAAAERYPFLRDVLRRRFLFDMDVLRAIFEKRKLQAKRLESFLKRGDQFKSFFPNRHGSDTQWAEVGVVHILWRSASVPGGFRCDKLSFAFYCHGDGPFEVDRPPAQVSVDLCLENWRLAYGSCYKPFVNPGLIKLRNAVKVRPYALHWFETHQQAVCAPGGRGRKRDFEDFEADFGA